MAGAAASGSVAVNATSCRALLTYRGRPGSGPISPASLHPPMASVHRLASKLEDFRLGVFSGVGVLLRLPDGGRPLG